MLIIVTKQNKKSYFLIKEILAYVLEAANKKA
jgi:hypothetical protein